MLFGISGQCSCPHILCSCCCSRTSPFSFCVEQQREVTERGDTEKVSLWCVPPFLNQVQSLLHWPYYVDPGYHYICLGQVNIAYPYGNANTPAFQRSGQKISHPAGHSKFTSGRVFTLHRTADANVGREGLHRLNADERLVTAELHAFWLATFF